MKKYFIIAFLSLALFAACKKTPEVHEKPFYPAVGAINARYSIGDNTTVVFAQGNLQYQASTGTWRFAENQYDMIGSGNANISASYSGWIDLFGWGTGNNPTNSSTNDSDYSTFVDWGVNAISNGGNKANLWRTLTNDEWGYLFNTRANASAKYGQATVAGVNGIIVLPDVYEGTAINTDHSAYSNNTISAEAWAAYEANGAVFLPAAGYRNGTVVGNVGSNGYYWSSTLNENNPGYAWNFYFYSGNVITGSFDNRYRGFSVRPVR
jgi:hypothetical protein